MRARGDLCILALSNGCHELNERQRCANVIRAVLPKNLHRAQWIFAYLNSHRDIVGEYVKEYFLLLEREYWID